MRTSWVRALVGAAALLLAVAVPLVSAPAAAAPPPSPAGWGWPLEDAAGPPRVLRRARLPAQPWAPGHRGVDLAAVAGQAVLAPVGGVVVAAGPVGGRPVVSVRSPSGWRATLEPVEAAVRVGEVVVRGQVVGALAAPAAGAEHHCGAQPCLHWGVRTGTGAAVRYRDPLALLRRRAVLLPVPGW